MGEHLSHQKVCMPLNISLVGNSGTGNKKHNISTDLLKKKNVVIFSATMDVPLTIKHAMLWILHRYMIEKPG